MFTIPATATIISEININYTDIFCSLWIHNTETNMYITYILDGYTKDRDTDSGDYITTDKKPVKVDSYRISIIAVNIPNGLNTITFTDITYYFIFLTNITSTKHFQFKKIYLDEKHSQLHKKKVI